MAGAGAVKNGRLRHKACRIFIRIPVICSAHKTDLVNSMGLKCIGKDSGNSSTLHIFVLQLVLRRMFSINLK